MPWYFTFGSNMHPSVLRRRQVTPQITLRAVLPGWVYTNDYVGLPLFEPSFATIRTRECWSKRNNGPSVPTTPPDVQGAAYLISEEDLQRILRTEGGGGHAGVGYVTTDVVCHVYKEDAEKVPAEFRVPLPRAAADGKCREATVGVRAITLVGTGRAVACPMPLEPSIRYAYLVHSGAKQIGLDASYVSFLESQVAMRPTLFGRVCGFLLLLLGLPVLSVHIGTTYFRGRSPRLSHIALIWYSHLVTMLVWLLQHVVPASACRRHCKGPHAPKRRKKKRQSGSSRQPGAAAKPHSKSE